ncbi:hypothetical protein LTR64_000267 [Lithohypha guttulata]|uniref:uncharacterized protein n=1 Tax=Lithohypha guttulata TaxID=1690604 RepID=UPI002DE1D8B7|nr:hypothetical protein LTR51_007628 [Lithohypha guttulata]
MDAALFPVGTNASSHGISGLDANSYTAHKLKHATPEHLHLTTRRFFIGPIPEGWLSSNRKSWYKRRLELNSYSSKAATFHAAAGQAHHQRSRTGLDRSAAARLSISFPQPEDVEDSRSERGDGIDSAQEDDEYGLEDTVEMEPVSTLDQNAFSDGETESQLPETPLDPSRPPALHNLDGASAGSLQEDVFVTPAPSPQVRREGESGIDIQEIPPESDLATRPSTDANFSDTLRTSASVTGGSSFRQYGLTARQDSIEAGSRTALLAPAKPEDEPSPSRKDKNALDKHDPRPVTQKSDEHHLQKDRSAGVRFRVGEAVADRGRRVGKRADNAKNKVGRRIARRQTLQEGIIVKMEKMLVRVDTTLQQVPAEYDENDSMRMATKVVEKWREFMVVARKSRRDDEEDFRLQFYKTRVIPEIDDNSGKKKPTREIKLIRKSTHVNLFSSLDKSLVVWHPCRKGTRITVMKCESAATSVEWYTFLRDALGWKRPDTLQVSVPGLDVTLQIEKPFDDLVKAGRDARDAQDEETALAKAEEAEQAIAGRIVNQCTDMLRKNPEWSDIVQKWSATSKPGLAWKRYDRLEWIHGVNEQKMYGSMAMQHSYELELRPKVHYPQTATGNNGREHEEPAPIEGFLIRMTSQKGIHKRLGKTFFKRLYFSTHDQFLIFSRPAQATPPHPPRLQTTSGADVPSAREIVEKTPIMFDIDPYPLNTSQTEVEWLASGIPDSVQRHDREALEEARRNHANLDSSDGYINMTRIRTVRQMRWGTDEVDDTIDSGPDVDFHESVPDTVTPDGATSNIDDNRIFELILDNSLVIRLQAYDNRTRDEWIRRLKQLVKYWKIRKTADMNTFKQVRATNLTTLKIDEDVEAELGQFGHKWEVTRSEASPQLYNICSISNCRTISLSGLLYRKARRHGTFQRCGVVLAGGKMLIYQSTLRTSSGKQVPNIHQEKQEAIDLRGCYIYSGLIVDDDLLYQNRTFDANHIGTMASLPRVWTEDGWTSTDVDVMCCFVVWMNTRKGWFRTAGNTIFGRENNPSNATDDTNTANNESSLGKQRAKLKRVKQLGVPGRGIVFKCRSRAERNLWVLNLNIELERLVARQKWEAEAEGGEVRLAG